MKYLLPLLLALSLHAQPRITSIHVGPNTMSAPFMVWGGFGFWMVQVPEQVVELSFTTKPRRAYRVECRMEFCNPWIGTQRCDWMSTGDLIIGTGREVRSRHKLTTVYRGTPLESCFYRVVELR